MTDLPVIMSAPMVIATLREVETPGTGKTMTRRMAWREKEVLAPDGENGILRIPSLWQNVKPGDRLWVREPLLRSSPGGHWRYAADGTVILMRRDDPRVSGMIAWAHHYDHDNAPSRHMPRVLSRLTLIVTATKMERVQEISEADAKAEGAQLIDEVSGRVSLDDRRGSYRNGFRALWNSLHGDGVWGANPEVIPITFRPVLANVDVLTKEAA